jgi:hypothetical protein
MAIKKPWAVLVCRFSDDADPATVLVKDLPALDPTAANDTRTVLELFKQFFTTEGISTFNAVRYFNEMSHGTIDLNDSQVFVVNLNYTKAQADELSVDPGGGAYEATITTAAQNAAIQQGVSLQNYYGIVITSHHPLAMAQGGPIPGGAVVAGPAGWAGLDYRWVRNNGIQAFGQEMGHGFGLDHSRVDGSHADYRDPWDVMSTVIAFSGPDPDYHARGPGINAWNMRSRGWLDESRVWHCPHGSFKQVVNLRPLHRTDLPGFLAAELPPILGGGVPMYLVEYRKKENWDNGIPRSCVLVHRFEGPMKRFLGTHSYVMQGNNGQSDLVVGDSFGSTYYGPQLFVLNIDDNSSTATIGLRSYPAPHPPRPWPIYDPWWWIETHGGVVPPGPPAPWSQDSITALAALIHTADLVAPELRSRVLEIALQQAATLSNEIKEQMAKIKGHTSEEKRPL